MRDYIFTLSGVVIGVLLSFQGCSVAPRSEVYCVKKGDWVKCPKGVPAGADLNKGDFNAKK